MMDMPEDKLDKLFDTMAAVRLSVSEMSGKQDKGHAELSGKLDLVNLRITTLESDQKNHNNSDVVIHSGISDRINAVESDVETLKGAKQFSAGKAAGLSGIVSLAVAIFLAFIAAIFKRYLGD